MKSQSILKISLLSFVLLMAMEGFAQNPVNWTESQLEQPATLANSITSKKNIPVIISVGPGATIPNSIEIGMINHEAGVEKLETALKSIDRNKKVVVYCGCCPYEHCPNVRPAIDLLKEMKFTNYFLLDLPHNIKRDWIDKGYPVIKY